MVRVLCVSLFVFYFSLTTKGRQFILEDFKPNAGQLSNSTISCMLQDSEGYLWMGTWDGLNRYDAYDIDIFRHISNDSMSIADNIIDALTEGPHGNIWIGTGKGLSVYDKSENQFLNFDFDISLRIRSLHSDKNYLWIGTDNGVYRLNIEDRLLKHFPLLENTSVRVNGIISNDHQEIYLATSEGLFLSSYQKMNFIQFKNTLHNTPGASNINAVELAGDSLYLATYFGAFVFDLQKRFFFSLVDESENNDHFKDIICKNNTIWLLSDQNGILRFNQNLSGKKKYSFTNEADARFLFYDRTGVMWISITKDGLKYTPHKQPFVKYTLSSNQTEEQKTLSVLNLLKYDDTLCWMGTNNGLILYDHKNQKIVSHYFENTEFRSLVQTSETEIWAGSLSEGLYHFKLEPETGEIDLIRIYEQNSGLETNVIFSAFVDSDKGIWLGSYDSFFYKSKEGASFNRVEMQLKDTLIKKVQVWTFFEDHSGRIWIGTQRNGLFYYEKSNGKFFRFFSENKNADERINAVKAFCQADSNSLFVGTEGNGLFNIDFTSEKVFVFNESDGLQNNSIWSILPDPDEGLWLSTNKGITKFSDHRFQNYSVSDGLPCSEFNPGSGLYMNDSLLIFGCTRGLTGFNPSDIEPRNFNPECAFTEVFVNDHIAIPVHEDSSNYILDLPRGKYNIQIRFSAFEFSSPQKVNYLYKLEGWNTTWISTNAENRKVYYYSLPPGKYTFHLKTALNNEDWKWADEKLIIHIAQPWQKNKYVLVAIVLLIITTGYILYRRKSKLSAMIGERVKTGNVFLGKAQSIVHKHIDDPRFSVEQLASELSMSRSSLHKKLKSATRQSASSFIRDIRLEKARVMLIEENVSVKEAAYRCGFSDSSYFTKCFKQKYGMLPTAV